MLRTWILCVSVLSVLCKGKCVKFLSHSVAVALEIAMMVLGCSTTWPDWVTEKTIPTDTDWSTRLPFRFIFVFLGLQLEVWLCTQLACHSDLILLLHETLLVLLFLMSFQACENIVQVFQIVSCVDSVINSVFYFSIQNSPILYWRVPYYTRLVAIR